MNEQELLRQIAQLFHDNNEVLIQMMDEKIQASEQRTHAWIENTVVKRIDSLFDGYAAEQARLNLLQTRVSELESRLDTLETFVKTRLAS